MKSYSILILPLLTFGRLEDGTKVINIGWIKKVYTINLKFHSSKIRNNERLND